jgi:uncharacterized coiled-coil protein SlyX
MPIKTNDQQQLDSLFAEHGRRYSGCREDYFALLYLKRKFKVNVDEIAHQVAFGGNDYGIDAYYFDRDARNMYLFQFKWTEDHGQFKSSMERVAKDGLARIFDSHNQDAEQNELISYLKKALKEHRELIDRVYVHFVFKGDIDAAEKSEGLSNRREDIEDKAHLITAFFGDRHVELQVDFIADKPGHRGPPPAQSYVVHLREAGTVTHGGRTMHVGFVPLMELYGIFKALGQKFFDRNIRAGLSPDNAPNKKIREALDRIVLKETEEPSIFVFRHNGVTLAAERVEVLNGEATLHVPRLLNGAQTVSSVALFLDTHAENPLLKKNRDRLNAISVLAKIIQDDPSSEFITQVTISNNQQNPVLPWALRAMDQKQVDLADKFREELGIFYSRQEGAFENLSDEEKEEQGIEDSRDIRLRPLAQTFLAVQGDVYNMGHLPEVFESQNLYEGAFKSAYLLSNVRSIVLAYKVGLMMGQVTARLKEALAQKYQTAIPKARNLTWALLVQALLNDRKLTDFLEDYGSNLIKQAAFRDILKQLIGSRVAPIMRDLIINPTYKEKVAQDKYDFLRTTEAFKKAMTIASSKYPGWNKKSF